MWRKLWEQRGRAGSLASDDEATGYMTLGLPGIVEAAFMGT